METFVAALVVAFLTVLVCLAIFKGREKKISVDIVSTDEKQAWELFIKKVGSKIPKDVVKVTKYPTSFDFSFTTKKIKK